MIKRLPRSKWKQKPFQFVSNYFPLCKFSFLSISSRLSRRSKIIIFPDSSSTSSESTQRGLNGKKKVSIDESVEYNQKRLKNAFTHLSKEREGNIMLCSHLILHAIYDRSRGEKATRNRNPLTWKEGRDSENDIVWWKAFIWCSFFFQTSSPASFFTL